MHKWFIALAAVYFMGDPGLTLLESIGEMKLPAIVGVLSLLVAPWVVSQIDG